MTLVLFAASGGSRSEQVVRIVLAGPDTQFVEGVVAVAIGGTHEVNELAHEVGWPVMGRVPVFGQHQVFQAHEVLDALHLGIDHDSGLRRIQVTVSNQIAVDVVQAHGAVLGSADTAIHRDIARCFRGCGIGEGSGGLAHDLNQGGRGWGGILGRNRCRSAEDGQPNGMGQHPTDEM